ncbi:MAG: hypothetical protein R2819_01360 [Allomuricauda sp.]
MKTRPFYPALAVLLAIATSCNHDGDDYPNTIDQPLGEGVLTLNGENYTTNFAYALDYGTYPNSDRQKFTLVVSDDVFDGTSFSNSITNMLGIELSSETLGYIEDGEYYFSSNGWHPPFSISEAYGYFNLVYQNGDIIDGDTYETIVAGTLTFNDSSNETHITYEIEFASGDSIQGEYKGDIKYFTLTDQLISSKTIK